MKYIDTLPGPEDMALDLDGLRIIVSCCQRRGKDGPKNKKDWKAGFGYINLATEQFQEFVFDNLPAGASIKPHGIDIIKQDGKQYLYSISHCGLDGSNKHVILKFKVESNKLIHIDTFQSSEHLILPNDLAVLPDGSFYVTNISTKPNFIGQIFDLTLNLKTGNVVYYKNGLWQVAIKNLPFANGIASKCNYVYVAPTYDFYLHVYNKEKDGKLTLVDKIKTTKGMDNISLIDDHHALVAVHTNFPKFISYLSGLSKTSPIAVLKFNLQDKLVETIYADSGKAISTSSTAILHQNKLYISQIFKGQVLVVDVV